MNFYTIAVLRLVTTSNVDIGVRGFERDYVYRLRNTFKLKVVIGQKIFPIL
jgi:hypothetical protein